MIKHSLKRTDKKALLQILSGTFLIAVVFVFGLYETKGFGVHASDAGALILGENISGEDTYPSLYLNAATYGVIGMDITEYELREEVLLAEAGGETAQGQSGSMAQRSVYTGSGSDSVIVMGGVGDEAEDPDGENTEDEVSDEQTDETVSEETEETSREEEDEESESSESTIADTDRAEESSTTEEDDSQVESCVNETRESEDPVTAEEEPVYVAYSADQIKNIIRTKRYGGNIDSMVAELANCPDDRARVWEEIFDYWDEVNQPGFTTKYNTNSGANPSLPAGLPHDDSLCFVVLGCGLNANGTIRPEMEYRCQTALKCWELYPNAYVLCTGGHTAAGNYAASEGGVMGNWLIEHGVDASHVIIEDASYQTCENAMKSVPLLKNRYPQVDQLVLVTSDYHVPLGALTLQAECLLDGNARVVANVGCAAPRYVNFGNGELGKQLEKLAFTGRR